MVNIDTLVRVKGTPNQVHKFAEERGITLERPVTHSREDRDCIAWVARGSVRDLLHWHAASEPWASGFFPDGSLIEMKATTKRER